MTKKIISLVLALIMLMTIAPATFAEEQESDEEELSTWSFQFPSQYEGGSGVAYTLLYKVSESCVEFISYRDYTKVMKATLPSDAVKIYVKGLLYHSGDDTNGTDDMIRTGLGYLVNGIMQLGFCTEPESGRGFETFVCNKSQLTTNTEYYCYISNLQRSCGYVYGDVALYYSR